MSPGSFRKAQNWSLERLCEELGLQAGSKGHLSRLENAAEPSWPIELALKMQALSAGVVRARDLVPESKRPLLDQLVADTASRAEASA